MFFVVFKAEGTNVRLLIWQITPEYTAFLPPRLRYMQGEF